MQNLVETHPSLSKVQYNFQFANFLGICNSYWFWRGIWKLIDIKLFYTNQTTATLT